MHQLSKTAVAVLTCLATAFVSNSASAGLISDPEGDFTTDYLGPKRPDLDVVGIAVHQGVSNFILTGKMAGALNSASGATYVWGVNRGAGTARFGAKYSGVLFDTVIVAQAAGAVSLNLFDGTGNKALAASSMSFVGDTLTLTIAKSMLPSTGFNFDNYGFNLWPRASGAGGISQLSDFAPDNSVISDVPEPATLSLLGLGLAGLMRRRRA